MAKRDEAGIEAGDGKVVVRYEGPTGWDINFSGRGKMSVAPGQEVALNPRDTIELRALLGIIKEINRVRTNERLVLKPQTPDGFKEQVKVPKFRFVRGTENLPKILLEHKYSASAMLTDDEKKAVLELCPDFFKITHKPRFGVVV
ncbi:MAG: hypothetical protein M0R66_01285 [Candidatus Omnitrophica bacterium]|nr:hypothetical protein [Candidatus Omnitrophota bacterium]